MPFFENIFKKYSLFCLTHSPVRSLYCSTSAQLHVDSAYNSFDTGRQRECRGHWVGQWPQPIWNCIFIISRSDAIAVRVSAHMDLSELFTFQMSSVFHGFGTIYFYQRSNWRYTSDTHSNCVFLSRWTDQCHSPLVLEFLQDVDSLAEREDVLDTALKLEVMSKKKINITQQSSLFSNQISNGDKSTL